MSLYLKGWIVSRNLYKTLNKNVRITAYRLTRPFWLRSQTVKCLSTMWETRVPSLGWEESLEKEMEIHFLENLLPGKSHEQRSLVGYSPWGHKESDTTEQLHVHVQSVYETEEGGDPGRQTQNGHCQ